MNHLGELEVDGRKISELFLIGCDCVDWIHLAQGRVQLKAFVSTVMDI
jgi:hypothetical protein